MLRNLRRDDVLLTSAAVLLAVAIPLGVVSCDKVPLLAPTGTVITLLSTSNSVSLNSSATIIATVIENGQAAGTGTGTGVTTTTTSGAGTPVQNGTLISFTTTIGRIEPADARTHNGQVSVQLMTTGQSGTATVTAYSGGASSTLQLKIGAAAATRVQMSAIPRTLPSTGGTSLITAQISDDGGSPISGLPITFTTDAGTLTTSNTTTDSNGAASTTLTTAATAHVVALFPGAAGGDTGSGSGSAGSGNSVTVTVGAKALASFSATPASAPAGTPIVFTVTPNTGANIQGGTIDYGDGATDSLGSLSTGPATFQHVYRSAGAFTATVTAIDATGGPQTLTTTVVIGALSVTLSASPNPVTAGSPTTLTATVPAGIQVASYTFTFDDAPPQTQTGNTFSKVFNARGNHVVRVDVTAVGGGTGQATTNVSVQ